MAMNSLNKGFTSTEVGQVMPQGTGTARGAKPQCARPHPCRGEDNFAASGVVSWCYEEKQVGGGWRQALQPVVGQGLAGTSKNTTERSVLGRSLQAEGASGVAAAGQVLSLFKEV